MMNNKFTDLDNANHPVVIPDNAYDINSHAHDDDEPDFWDNAYQYEFMSTPFNPVKYDHCRVENLLMTFSFVACMAFGIASLNTPLAQYKDNNSNLRIVLTSQRIHGCIDETCRDDDLSTVFCRSFTSSTSGYFVTTIIGVVFAFIGFVPSMATLAGRVIIGKYFIHFIAVLTLICFFISTICAGTVRNTRYCSKPALGAVGFSYGPAFALVLTALLVHFFTTLFYFIRRCLNPVHYRYN